MRIQHSEIIHETESTPSKKKEKYAIIAVASGNGIKDIFKELEVNYIVDGGQTMNPPTDDFLKAIKIVNAEHVIILPNNSNIILTANQAASLCDNCDVKVLRTKNVAEGYSAIMGFDPSLELDEILSEMQNNFSHCVSGEVTYSIRDTKLDGIEIKKGDYIGMSRSHILHSSTSKVTTTKELIKKMINEESNIVTVFYGSDVTSKERASIKAFLDKTYPELEHEFLEGKQDVYSFIIGVE
jgi:dihydroxyacetone kinase-like predicted kinase